MVSLDQVLRVASEGMNLPERAVLAAAEFYNLERHPNVLSVEFFLDELDEFSGGTFLVGTVYVNKKFPTIASVEELLNQYVPSIKGLKENELEEKIPKKERLRIKRNYSYDSDRKLWLGDYRLESEAHSLRVDFHYLPSSKVFFDAFFDDIL